MKLLFDQNISFRVLNLINALYPESKHVKDFGLQHSSDRQIWNFAKGNGFHIVTYDADFYDLVTLYGHPPKVIWLRLGNTSSQNIAKKLNDYSDAVRKFIENIECKDLACLEISWGILKVKWVLQKQLLQNVSTASISTNIWPSSGFCKQRSSSC